MEEWHKIILATVAGFAGGILAEPFKQNTKDVFLRRRIRRSIRLAAYIIWNELVATIENKKPERYMVFDGFDELAYYIEKETGQFWRVYGADLVKGLLDQRKAALANRQVAATAIMAMALPAHVSNRCFGRSVTRKIREDFRRIRPALENLVPEAFEGIRATAAEK